MHSLSRWKRLHSNIYFHPSAIAVSLITTLGLLATYSHCGSWLCLVLFGDCTLLHFISHLVDPLHIACAAGAAIVVFVLSSACNTTSCFILFFPILTGPSALVFTILWHRMLPTACYRILPVGPQVCPGRRSHEHGSTGARRATAAPAVSSWVLQVNTESAQHRHNSRSRRQHTAVPSLVLVE